MEWLKAISWRGDFRKQTLWQPCDIHLPSKGRCLARADAWIPVTSVHRTHGLSTRLTKTFQRKGQFKTGKYAFNYLQELLTAFFLIFKWVRGFKHYLYGWLWTQGFQHKDNLFIRIHLMSFKMLFLFLFDYISCWVSFMYQCPQVFFTLTGFGSFLRTSQ